MESIGKKIKELRRKNDMTQEKLADYLCVAYQTVSKWETGVTSPDLSLIVPLARLFKVTTDELFDYNESLEDMKRSELQARYDETFKTGDLDVRMSVCAEAVKAYPGDMKWLNNYAWDIWCQAVMISDDVLFAKERDKAIALFQKVIENCGNDEIKCNSIVGIVGCLNGKGEHDEAKKYAELYPDTKINADERESLLISCMSGEAQIMAKQERLLHKTEDFLQLLIQGEMSWDEINAAYTIIQALIPDGNYQTFNHALYMIALGEARREISLGNIDRAMLAMKKARNHAIAYDNIKGEYSFTAPLFNRIRYNSNDWWKTGTNTELEDFKALLDFPVYAPLKSHKDYARLIE